MTEHQSETVTRKSSTDSMEGSSYLGQKGESFFIRTSGKGNFKVANLISRSTFDLVHAFFISEEEARLFAAKRSLRIVDFTDSACSASPD
jgi:hypothetical protein